MVAIRFIHACVSVYMRLKQLVKPSIRTKSPPEIKHKIQIYCSKGTRADCEKRMFTPKINYKHRKGHDKIKRFDLIDITFTNLNSS